MQGIGCELGGVALAHAEAAELGGDLAGADTRGVKQLALAHEADDGAAGGDHSAAATRVETGVTDARDGTVRVDRERDADQIAAGGSAGGRGECGLRGVTAPTGAFEMTGQLLCARAHRASVGLGVASFVDRLFDREGGRQAGDDRRLAALADEQQRRRAEHLHAAGDRAER